MQSTVVRAAVWSTYTGDFTPSQTGRPRPALLLGGICTGRELYFSQKIQ